jgi:hypothetical protein
MLINRCHLFFPFVLFISNKIRTFSNGLLANAVSQKQDVLHQQTYLAPSNSRSLGVWGAVEGVEKDKREEKGIEARPSLSSLP